MEKRGIRGSTVLIAVGGFLAGLVAVVVVVRRPMEPLTQVAIDEARTRWRETRIADYDVTLVTHGGTYEMVVRGGAVQSLLLNGHPAGSKQPEMYTIEGLFETLEMELDMVRILPRGGTVFQRAAFDPQYGFPRRYLRSGGSTPGLVIEVTVFAVR